MQVIYDAQSRKEMVDCYLLRLLSIKRSENLVAFYSYWPISSSKRSRYSNRAVTTLILVIK